MPKFHRLLLIAGASVLVLLFQNCGKQKNVLSGNVDLNSLNSSTAPDMWTLDTANILKATNPADFGSSTPNITMYPTLGSFQISPMSTPPDVPFYEFFGVIKNPTLVIQSCLLNPSANDEFKISVRCPGHVGDIAACDAKVIGKTLDINNPPEGVTIQMLMGGTHMATSGTLLVSSYATKPPLSSNFYFVSGIYEVVLKNVGFGTYELGKSPATILNYSGLHKGETWIESEIKNRIAGCKP